MNVSFASYPSPITMGQGWGEGSSLSPYSWAWPVRLP